MKKIFETVKLILIANIVIALSISLLVWLLSLLLYLMQSSADHLGYTFLMSDEIKKTVLTVGGAIVVAVVAFYGVRTQNISAEARHKTDKELDLKKDIFLKATEEFSAQYEYLISFIKDEVTQTDRTKLVENVGKAFFKIQMVANENTIKAAAEAIQEWAIASNKIAFIGLIPEGETSVGTGINKLERLIEIQKISLPFLKKFWQFIITARAEIKSASPFANNDKYLEYMETKQKELIEFIESSIVGLKGLN